MAALAPNSCIQYRELCTRDYGMQPPSSGGRGCSVVGSSGRGLARRLESDGAMVIKGRTRGEVHKLGAFWQDVSHPTSVGMESIESLEEFEEILRVSKENSQPIIVDWMATWCRKCIYLKPKLEKLAADYPRIKFYYVDVNKVPQTLVKRGNISKMPTIQLWKDGELKAEVIGGHKAWLVLDEVRDMIQKNEEEHMATLMEEEEG